MPMGRSCVGNSRLKPPEFKPSPLRWQPRLCAWAGWVSTGSASH